MSDDARIQRFVQDAALSTSKALPAAGAANVHTTLDLGAVQPGQMVNDFDVLIAIPATPSLVDTKNATLTLKDSDDGVTFTAIPSLAPLIVTGAGGVGQAGTSRTYKLPPTVRRYLRLEQAVDAAGGDNTAVSSTLVLVF